MTNLLASYMDTMPLIAILRGVTPEEVIDVVACLVESGIRIVEVPLNSPDALRSISFLSERYSDELLIGAGTVITVQQVQAVADAGGKIIVSPNVDIEVIQASKRLGLVSAPGVATPSEAFQAIQAGADVVKAFPAEMLAPAVIKSWKAVLPKEVPVIPVGGIDESNMEAYWKAGARGFGLGGSLYKSGKSLTAVRESARLAVAEVERLKASTDNRVG